MMNLTRAGRAPAARIAAAVLAAVCLGAAILAAAPTGAALRSRPGGEGRDAAPLPARRAYADSLRLAVGEAGYAGWVRSGERALESAPTIRPPYVETGVFTGGSDARGYRIELQSGERLVIDLAAEPGHEDAFLDIFFAPHDSAASPFLSRHGAGRLEYRARTDGAVVVRLQPRLGATGGYDLRLDRIPALTFPVAHDGARVIGRFLDARDDGIRRHRGIDIQAPRGTPVVAAATGVVERVGENELGGLVVWLRETGSNRTHYYAHLDAHRVSRGARVRAGDIVGTVGTTGNASESAPHLHFGIYRSGTAVNPLVYLDPPDAAARDHQADDRADMGLVGGRARTRAAGAAFRTTNVYDARTASSLPRHTELHVLAAAGRFYRVRTQSGAEGFLAAWLLERV